MRLTTLPCPHCKSQVYVSKSRIMSPLMKEITYQCKNPECSCSFVATLEALRMLSPSAMPDPEIRIDMSQHIRQRVAAQLAQYS